ncbi:unnamed protein product [Phaeothamnion confervicola]
MGNNPAPAHPPYKPYLIDERDVDSPVFDPKTQRTRDASGAFNKRRPLFMGQLVDDGDGNGGDGGDGGDVGDGNGAPAADSLVSPLPLPLPPAPPSEGGSSSGRPPSLSRRASKPGGTGGGEPQTLELQRRPNSEVLRRGSVTSDIGDRSTSSSRRPASLRYNTTMSRAASQAAAEDGEDGGLREINPDYSFFSPRVYDSTARRQGFQT